MIRVFDSIDMLLYLAGSICKQTAVKYKATTFFHSRQNRYLSFTHCLIKSCRRLRNLSLLSRGNTMPPQPLTIHRSCTDLRSHREPPHNLPLRPPDPVPNPLQHTLHNPQHSRQKVRPRPTLTDPHQTCSSGSHCRPGRFNGLLAQFVPSLIMQNACEYQCENGNAKQEEGEEG